MRGFFLLSYFLELTAFSDQKTQTYRVAIVYHINHPQTISGGIRLGNHFITVGVDFGIPLQDFASNGYDQSFDGMLHKLHIPKTDRIARDKNRCLSIGVSAPLFSYPSGSVAKGIS